jgi:hypothetical protein
MSATDSSAPTSTNDDSKSEPKKDQEKEPKSYMACTVDELLATLQKVKEKHGGDLEIYMQSYHPDIKGCSTWNEAVYAFVDTIVQTKPNADGVIHNVLVRTSSSHASNTDTPQRALLICFQ